MELEEFKQAKYTLDQELTDLISKRLTEFSKKYKTVPREININVTHGSSFTRSEEDNPEQYHNSHARVISKFTF